MEAWLVTLQAADKAVDNLAAGLATLAQGRLSPWLFSPQNLINVMEHVRKVMPEGWNLPSSLRDGDLWTFYKEAKTVAAATQNGIKVFIEIPVVQTGWTLHLFRVLPLPRKVKADQRGWMYEQLPSFIAVSNDRQSYAEVPADEVQKCLDGRRATCAVHRPLHRKHGKHSCAVALFLNDTRKIKNECVIRRTDWIGTEMTYLSGGRWAISADSTQQVVVNCADRDHGGPATMVIPEFGIIQMPPGCGVGADTWTLPASLWKAFSVKHVDLIQPFIANLTKLATEDATPTSATEKPMKMARSPWEKVAAIQQLLQANDRARKRNDVTAIDAKTIMDSWQMLNIENQYPVELLLAVVGLTIACIAMGGILFSKRKLRCEDTELNVMEMLKRMQKIETTLAERGGQGTTETVAE